MIDAQLKAIAHPARRAILALTWTRELTAGDVADSFTVSRPAVSQHLRALVQAGLLLERREDTRRFYRTNHAGLGVLRTELEAFWAMGLGRLKHTIERDLRGHRRSRKRPGTAARRRK